MLKFEYKGLITKTLKLEIDANKDKSSLKLVLFDVLPKFTSHTCI